MLDNDPRTYREEMLGKLPEITALFWVMKICATTLGETGGDLLSMTMNIGYATSTVLLMGVFVLTLLGQLSVQRYYPAIYWLVILSTSTAGTTMSDYMDRTLEVGYAAGSLILAALLLITLALWKWSTGHLSVDRIRSRKEELFYWTAILFSNTLGTALGDYLADDSGLGFSGGATLIAAALLLIVIAHYATPISRVTLFWFAFVLTRPFGATLGDVLTKGSERGGLGFGTKGSSAVLGGVLLILIIYATNAEDRKQRLIDAS